MSAGSDAQAMITDVFVYGTLQRGQCRGAMWPRQPLAVRPAYIRGRLFDLGPYPAIRCDGEQVELDWIAGEVWSFAAEDIAETMETLDEIEETNQPGRFNLYDQILVRAHRQPASPESVLALAYQYSNAASLAADQRIVCASSGPVAWPSDRGGEGTERQ